MNSKVLSILVLSALGASSANASQWNLANNPENFNTKTNTDDFNWHQAQYSYQFSALPVEGVVPNENIPWGDSYWPMQRGGMAYRWFAFQNQSNTDQSLSYNDRVNKFFKYTKYKLNDLRRMSQEQIAQLSPLEKYSIYIGDYNYSITNAYLKIKKNAPRDYWEGYCHAWTAASSHYSEPMPVVKTNADGIQIPFGSADVKALLTANYDRLNWSGNPLAKILKGGEDANRRQVGMRCGSHFMYPTTKIKNGREMMTDYSDTDGLLNGELENNIRDYLAKSARVTGSRVENQEQLIATALKDAESEACADTNAGAFHVIVANQLGRLHEGFLMDKTRDSEVWNQPAFRFKSEVKSYEAPSRNSAPGTVKVAVVETKLYYADDTDYGWAFWNPGLSGIFNLQPYYNGLKEELKKYGDMLIHEGDETEHLAYPGHILAHANYKYKVEINSAGNIIGGEWLTLDRPDYLWLMKKEGFEGDFKRLGEIYQPISVPANAVPNFGEEQ
jgi:hypothetical protein